MIIGSLGHKLYFMQPFLLSSSNKMEIKNIMLDEIKIDEALLEFIDEKREWGYDTIIYGTFKNTLEAGNIYGVNEVPIHKLLLKRRKKDELTWHNVKMFSFSKEVERYNFKDSLVESLETYEYSVQPVMESGVMGSDTVGEVITDFDGVWMIGNEYSYQIKYNTEIGAISTNTVTNMVTTLGSKYPFIVVNGSISYKTFEVRGRIMSNETLSLEGGIDRFAEKKTRVKLESFLYDKKPKIIKDNSGNYLLVQINNDIQLEPVNDFGRQMYDISFSVIEIGDAYDEDLLLSYGIIKSEDLQVVSENE